MKRRVTIEDIAAEVGVSRQTVTRAMNGMPRISPQTRERVLEASRRLGYQPSRFAKNLASNTKTRAIGFVVESFRNPYYSEFTAELLSLTAARGWQMNVSSQEVASPLELPRRLAGEVDVVVGYFDSDPLELVTATQGIPVILIGEAPQLPGLHSVSIDFGTGVETLLEGLRQRGSKRFGLLETNLVTRDYRHSDRRRAYERHAGPDSREAIVVCDMDLRSIDAGAVGFRQLMREHPETDTVVAFTDLMAMGALSAAHADGLVVPGDVRIVGTDGLSLGSLTVPPLSSLDVIHCGLAEAVTDLIERVLDGTAEPSEHVTVTPLPPVARERLRPPLHGEGAALPDGPCDGLRTTPTCGGILASRRPAHGRAPRRARRRRRAKPRSVPSASCARGPGASPPSDRGVPPAVVRNQTCTQR